MVLKVKLLPSPNTISGTPSFSFIQPFTERNPSVSIKNKLKSKFQKPSIYISRVKRKRRMVFIEQINRKQYVMKRKIAVYITEKQIYNAAKVHLRGIEQPLRKFCGSLEYYKSLLNSITSEEEICPICAQKAASGNLKKRILVHIHYIISFIKNGEYKRQFKEMLTGLGNKVALSSIETDKYLQNYLKEKLSDCSMVRRGKKETLIFFKKKLLTTKLCGLCECKVEQKYVGRVLSIIDSKLASLQ